MASRAVLCWRSLAGRGSSARPMSTASAPRMRAIPTAAEVPDHQLYSGEAKKWWARGEFVPIYVVLGLVGLALSFAAHTAKQQIAYSPGVRVSKKRRETIPEVVDPDLVATEADRFINKSLFRRVAHIQDMDAKRSGITDPTRPSDPFRTPRKVEDLKTVGVDPRVH